MKLDQRLQEVFRDVPDFPKPGIVFKDITPLLKNAELCRDVTRHLAQLARPLNLDAIVGIESRGFLFGLPLAMELGIPFVPVRKKGKLPGETIGTSYALEYGQAEIEIHKDALKPGSRVMIHDDVLATGGTAKAAYDLIKLCDAEVASFTFLLELAALDGRELLKQFPCNMVTLAAC